MGVGFARAEVEVAGGPARRSMEVVARALRVGAGAVVRDEEEGAGREEVDGAVAVAVGVGAGES